MLSSFIVPTFNRAHVVRRAIDSVLSQRAEFLHGVEIIVIDDGSTDNTSAVLSTYQNDECVHVIRFAENRGLGAARNAGFTAARGTWCVLLDSDNALLPATARRLEALLAAAPPEAGVIWAHSADADGRSVVPHAVRGRVRGLDVLRQPLPGEHFSVIRRALATKHPYPSLNTRHACEPAFWAMLALSTDFVLSDEILQYYETSGADRFCAIDTRLARAGDLARCYEETARIVGRAAPRYHWELRGKAALYRCIEGHWRASLWDAARLLRGLPYAWRNAGVLVSVLAGPAASRWALRTLSGA